MEGMKYWIEAEGNGHYFFFAFPFVVILLFFLMQKRRVRFVVPAILITLIIVNPWFYEKWSELGLYAYWRILWIIPVVPCLASIVPSITEKIKNKGNKGWVYNTGIIAIAVFGVIGILLGGTLLYKGVGGLFVKAANVDKLPAATVAVANHLLELKKRPRIIADPDISVYIRQYSGEIQTLFGRDVYGFMGWPSDIAWTAYNEIGDYESDLSTVNRMMLDEGYDYLIIKNKGSIEGFNLVESIGDYGIYKTVGVPNIRKERNELGQVVSTINLDGNGYPMNNAAGYATVIYDYDDRNNIIYEFHTDIAGNGVGDRNGKAGCRRTFDSKDRIISQVALGANGNPIVTKTGYVEYRREYMGNNLISESFYDKNGILVNNINGYAREEREYDNASNMIVQRFLDQDRNPVITASGFAEKKCEYANGKLIREIYYDDKCKPLIQAAGYVAIEQTWDGQELLSRTYLDSNGLPMNRIDGYSKVVWTKDESGVINISFYDTNGSEVNRQGLNLVKDIKYGPDGWSEWMVPETGVENYGFVLGTINLGEKQEGDTYICSIEIEYSNVSCSELGTLQLWAQGTADDSWTIGNVWNNPILIDNPPDDGIYKYTWIGTVNKNMENASTFSIALRCDFWGSGAFRVRNINISDTEHEWKPGI